MLKPLARLHSTPFPAISKIHTSTVTCSKNRIYDSIRNEADFYTVLRLSATAGTPLITMWTASYCPSCCTVKPIIKGIIETRGDKKGGIGFIEIELDASSGRMGELGYRYLIRSLPTLLPFNHGEATDDKRLTDIRSMTDRERLYQWVEEVAKEGENNRMSGREWISSLLGN